jgi:predicted DNA-binding antitoxin AbrB/MazE fold protein
MYLSELHTTGGSLMALEFEAIYERGALKLPCELPLPDGHKVRVTIHSTGTAVDRLYGMLKWTGSQEDLDHLLGPDNHPWAREE